METNKNKMKPTSFGSSKTILGRRVLINLPDLELFHIKAKVDTGAYTSSLHCKDITMVLYKNEPWVSFTVFDEQTEKYLKKKSRILSEKTIKSSNGLKEKRFIIMVCLEMNDQKFDTPFTLTDRSEMKNQALIGRQALAGRFLVDVSQTYKRSKD